MIIDTHAHLYWESFVEDFEEVIQRALDTKVTTVINIGVAVDLSKKALEQVEDKLSKYSGLTAYSTVGIHPHEAIKYLTRQNSDGRHKNVNKDIDELEKIYRGNSEKVIAVGECGLDYKEVDEQSKKLQRQLFQAQIDLAKKLNLPLIVHCRDDRSQNPENSEAWDEVLKMVGDHPAVLHCYSGLLPTTNYILQTTNLLVSFAATLTYPKNDYLREAVKLLPLEKIVVETDCPFLPPQSKRGTRNEPSYIQETLQTIAQIKNLPLRQVESEIYQNTTKLFKL